MLSKAGVEKLTIMGLAAMLCATVFQQMPGPIYANLRRRDPGAFIPMWSFFAPRPATRDYEPLFRLIHADGSMSEWRKSLRHGHRTVISNIWAPERRLSKSIFDMSSELLPLLNQRDALAVEGSAAYSSLARFYLRKAREASEPNVVGVQFLIVLHGGFDVSEEPEILFTSKGHYLEANE